jgi:hypothetical protein
MISLLVGISERRLRPATQHSTAQHHGAHGETELLGCHGILAVWYHATHVKGYVLLMAVLRAVCSSSNSIPSSSMSPFTSEQRLKRE